MSSSPRPGATLGVVFLVLFLDLVGFSIVFPLFAAMMTHYGAQDSGLFALAANHLTSLFPQATPAQQAALFGGLLTGLYAGLQFIAAPIWGRLSDRIGRRPVVLFSLAGSLVAYALWAFTSSFELFVVSRLIAGVMSGNVSAANAAVSDITTPETRSKGMAVIGMAFGLGFVLGPAIGGLTSTLASPFPANPFAIPALIACGLAAVNLAWAARSFRETLPPERRVSGPGEAAGRTADPRAPFLAALGPAVPKINGAFLLHTLLFSGMEATLVFLAAEKLGYTPWHMGWLFTGLGLGSALVQGGVYRRLAPKIGERRLVIAGFASMPLAFLLLGLVDWYPSNALLIAGVAMLTIGTGIIFPGLNTMASLAGDPQRQGWVLGTFRSAGALGRAVGPLVASLIYFGVRPGAPYLLAAVAVVMPLWLVLSLRSMR